MRPFALTTVTAVAVTTYTHLAADILLIGFNVFKGLQNVSSLEACRMFLQRT
jgi:hypothetical protein